MISYNKCAVYSIELKVDSILVFKYVMDEFSFNESRYINSHIDYETYKRENIYIERAFILPNDKLSVYKNLVNRGIYNFSDNARHTIEIIVSDIHGNKSVLTFNVTSAPVSSDQENSANQSKPDRGIMMPYNRNNRFVSKNVAVSFPPVLFMIHLVSNSEEVPDCRKCSPRYLTSIICILLFTKHTAFQ